jgi:hypothetical protein
MTGPANGTEQPDAMAEIDALARLLKEEIAAIGQGDFDKVTELFPRKASLLEAIEAAAPVMEDRAGAERDIRDKLIELQVLIQKDAALLERITDATRDLVSEISRIRDRHGLKGLYGAKGEDQAPTVAVSQRIDQQV